MNINHYKKHQFDEYVTINSLAIPAYESNQIDKKGNKRVIFYEWDNESNMMVQLFNKKTNIGKEDSQQIKRKADNFRSLPNEVYPGNVIKRIFDREKNELTHFIVEVGFDYDKVKEPYRWKYWKIPKGYTRRINHITDPFMG